ncbi:hypothetical protein MLD38_033661 [Melastoma candidum]|uniref:Uncharacterized protein n=1 Tax=Melastoma candidum TaxID=119954 RepID=A0ACB9MA42_9MYRT|nr:hypothetical protein MLD38_033661 [Melastoma candidum]
MMDPVMNDVGIDTECPSLTEDDEDFLWALRKMTSSFFSAPASSFGEENTKELEEEDGSLDWNCAVAAELRRCTMVEESARKGFSVRCSWEDRAIIREAFGTAIGSVGTRQRRTKANHFLYSD